jgi:hypothetical protein
VTGSSLQGIIETGSKSVRPFLHGQIENSHMIHDGAYKYLYDCEDGSELLYQCSGAANDRSECTDDKDTRRRMRAQLIEHLQEEKSCHVVDGELLNSRKEKPPANQARSRCMNASGLSWTSRHCYADRTIE